MSTSYQTGSPSRDDLDKRLGATVVEFGTDWCGHCRAAQEPIAAAFADHSGIAYLRIEDGKGRPTGRSYGVKLWPTLIFLADGREVARVVRPTDVEPVSRALAELDAAMQRSG